MWEICENDVQNMRKIYMKKGPGPKEAPGPGPGPWPRRLFWAWARARALFHMFCTFYAQIVRIFALNQCGSDVNRRKLTKSDWNY